MIRSTTSKQFELQLQRQYQRATDDCVFNCFADNCESIRALQCIGALLFTLLPVSHSAHYATATTTTHTHHSPRAVHRDRYSYDLCEWTHQRRGIIRPVKAGFLKLKEYYYYYRYLFWLLLSSQVFLINEHHGDKDRQTSNNVCLALTPLKLGIVAQH